jgi:hypothetical protein
MQQMLVPCFVRMGRDDLGLLAGNAWTSDRCTPLSERGLAAGQELERAPSSGWAGGAQALLTLALRLQAELDLPWRRRGRALLLSCVVAARLLCAGLVLAPGWAAAVGDTAPPLLKRGLCTFA